MHIGLIGGIGPAATDYYYQNIIRAFDARGEMLELTMVHASAPTLLGNLAGNRISDQVAIYSRLAKRLADAGADCVVITSIAGHFCINEFKPQSPLPVIDMIAETNKYIETMGVCKIGILGTRTVMETRFYGAISGAEILPPDGGDLERVHEAYVTMAATGQVNEQQRAVFDRACKRLLQERGAEAILLGGTDLALVYQPGNTEFPIIDCAALHCDAVVERAFVRN